MNRIVHIIVGLGRGGAERALSKLLEAQQGDAKYQHVVISLTDFGCYGESIKNLGVDVYAIGMSGVFGLPVALLRVVRLLRHLRPDILQTWMYHADFIGGIAALFAGRIPVIWGIHSFDLKRGAKFTTRIVQKFCAISSYFLPTLVLCVADASLRNHVALGYDPSRMRVIPNGFDIDEPKICSLDIASFRELNGISKENVVVGCVGRFHPAKDHRNFVDAAAVLAKTYPSVIFMMVGPELTAENSDLMAWIDGHGLRSRFVLLGERSDIPLCMSAMDIFCSPSRTEAFPLVVGEAMLMGRSCVVTDVGDTAFVVGNTAVVVERENSMALAAGLSRLLDLPNKERDRLGGRARERVCREFSLNNTVHLTLEAYEYVLCHYEKSKGSA